MDLKVLFCASEATPYAKTGGLADVAGALPKALSHLGCDVRLLVPLYPSAKEAAASLEPVQEWVPIPMGVHTYHVHLWKAAGSNGPTVYFLEKDEFYHRPHLYAHPQRGDYEDNAERFLALSRAIYPLCRHLDWTPHILHLHDWQTATAAAYLHFHWRHDPAFASTRSLLTIHNLGYQGLFPGSYFGLTGLPPQAFSMEGMEFWGQCNFLKAGLAYSHGLTTVSPRYSREIQQPENGFGLDGVLRSRSAQLRGILNGIDTSMWDPRTDPHLPAHFDAEHLSGKSECKRQVLRELAFPEEAEKNALCVMISRLVEQKGVDLILQALEPMMEQPLTLAVLGTGDPHLEQALVEAEKAHPDRIRVRLTFDEPLAHRLEAGADLFLMPSRYEPCGLNQMYSLRYGTIPVVAAVGGLDDSIADAQQLPHTGTGFKFHRHTPHDFLAALQAALDLYQDREKWRELQRRAMAQDFSWARAARAYLDLYRELAAP